MSLTHPSLIHSVSQDPTRNECAFDLQTKLTLRTEDGTVLHGTVGDTVLDDCPDGCPTGWEDAHAESAQ